ncbi:MAG: hypothetical protein QXD11_00060 [Candidatus Micrarchaeaceae archaeon]
MRSLKEFNSITKFMIPIAMLLMLLSESSTASSGIVSDISSIHGLLSQIGPMISALLFIIAGIFYAIGQMLPPDKRANFHTTAINIIIGAIVVGALSVASDGLAVASTHILNISSNAMQNISI